MSLYLGMSDNEYKTFNSYWLSVSSLPKSILQSWDLLLPESFSIFVMNKLGVFQSIQPFAASASGLIASVTIMRAASGFANWRLIFLVEGRTSVFCGFVAISSW